MSRNTAGLAQERGHDHGNPLEMSKQEAKIGKVMREFKRKSLRSSSGKKVTSRAQAIAIGISESKRV